MLQSPPNLKPGDLVYLCAPAKATEEIYIKAAEDLDLWMKLAMNGYRFGNCQEILLNYRSHNAQGSKTTLIQDEVCIYLSSNYAKYYFNSPLKDDYINHKCCYLKLYSIDQIFLLLNALYNELIFRNLSNNNLKRITASLFFRVKNYNFAFQYFKSKK